MKEDFVGVFDNAIFCYLAYIMECVVVLSNGPLLKPVSDVVGAHDQGVELDEFGFGDFGFSVWFFGG